MTRSLAAALCLARWVRLARHAARLLASRADAADRACRVLNPFRLALNLALLLARLAGRA